MDTLPNDDYDGAWKSALDVYLPEFLALCFPSIHAAIDWGRPYRFLETELQRASGEDQQGRRTADKLIEVWGHQGGTTWVLIHIEVQSQGQAEFARKMFEYYSRLRERFEHPVVSIAVLGDARPRWRPQTYETALWGCELRFRFPTIKLLDYRERIAELAALRNPVAALILAHLAAQRTRARPAHRLAEKLAITRRLYDQGYTPEQVRLAFGFIDWLLRLPDALKAQFVQELRMFEEERHMTYITSVEEVFIEQGLAKGMAKGLVQGLIEGIAGMLDLKFGDAAAPVITEVRQIADLATLKRVKDGIKPAQTLDDVRRIYGPTPES